MIVEDTNYLLQYSDFARLFVLSSCLQGL
jgi:hypothetical protein